MLSKFQKWMDALFSLPFCNFRDFCPLENVVVSHRASRSLFAAFVRLPQTRYQIPEALPYFVLD